MYREPAKESELEASLSSHCYQGVMEGVLMEQSIGPYGADRRGADNLLSEAASVKFWTLVEIALYVYICLYRNRYHMLKVLC